MLSHGTESKVQMILTGEENATQVRTLSDPKRPGLFKKGCLDAFLMSVDKPLGHLQYLQVIKGYSLFHKKNVHWMKRGMVNVHLSIYLKNSVNTGTSYCANTSMKCVVADIFICQHQLNSFALVFRSGTTTLGSGRCNRGTSATSSSTTFRPGKSSVSLLTGI